MMPVGLSVPNLTIVIVLDAINVISVKLFVIHYSFLPVHTIFNVLCIEFFFFVQSVSLIKQFGDFSKVLSVLHIF